MKNPPTRQKIEGERVVFIFQSYPISKTDPALLVHVKAISFLFCCVASCHYCLCRVLPPLPSFSIAAAALSLCWLLHLSRFLSDYITFTTARKRKQGRGLLLIMSLLVLRGPFFLFFLIFLSFFPPYTLLYLSFISL